ncbi:threonine ammonia-lyase IlvA [Pseudactinotalea sp. HY158]|uniref:threonine ammonia-lyase IlvA n=1 Tax=unclassified Pseudactinotalea TaxID=2649176 RepID=UPI00129CB240|nr:threonine ammonia-lyase IlvA [Pseudactinotalea sp. HY158]QGH70293.1 threonine ammonia-lyase IlvA [Pseudactinotalea sp. HY158]
MSTASPSAATAAPVVSAAAIREATQRLQGVVDRTALTHWKRMSRATGARVLIKREDQQAVRSYKVRGALNLMLSLTPEQRARGVVAASAGNHGQGVAEGCHDLGITGHIFLPRTTPRQKLQRIGELGGDMVHLHSVGSTYDEAYAASAAYAREHGAVPVHPFDDPRTIIGQGTVAKEIHDQLGSSPDIVVVPVGGGGLISGVASYLAEASPTTRVIGVEPAGASSMIAALAAGEPVTLAEIDNFVDGAAVRRVGDLPYEIVSRLRLRMAAVPEGRLCSEMLRLYQTEGIITEPAGALALAALGPLGSGAPVEISPGSTVVCVLTGSNNDVSRYAEVMERSLVHEGLRHYFLIDFPQQPGSLRLFLDEVLGPDDDISLFEYAKRSNRETGPAFVGLTLGRAGDYEPLLARMAATGLTYRVIAPDSPLFHLFV